MKTRLCIVVKIVNITSGMAPRGMIKVKTWIASRCGLPPSEVTFAELTRQAGYRNGFIGMFKSHQKKQQLFLCGCIVTQLDKTKKMSLISDFFLLLCLQTTSSTQSEQYLCVNALRK